MAILHFIMFLRSNPHPDNWRRRCLPLMTVRLLALFLCILWGRETLAAPTNAGHAQAAVSHWLAGNRHPLGAKLGQRVRQTETAFDADGQPVYHVVYLTTDGTSSTSYVIVSGDDEAEPIVAFCSGDHFDPSPTNPLGALVAADLPTRIALARHTKSAGSQASLSARRTKKKWDALLQTTAQEAGTGSLSDVRVEPFILSQWDQTTVSGTACYNYYTPPGSSGASANYPAGCVATALSQLMRYYQYPTTGVGTQSFTITVDSSSITEYLRGGDGAGGAYDWASMVLVPTTGVTVAQRQAIGNLLYDAGVSVNMDYASNGSAAETLLAKNALVNTFHYRNAVKGYNSGSDIGTPLIAMVNPNLDAGFPVLFGITDNQTGHAIVCDGYGYNSSTLYHHLNLGWSGNSNAWYALPNINAGGYNFSIIYKCVYNVFVTGSGEIISGRVTDHASNPIAGVAISAVRSSGGTYTATTNANGIYALPKIPSSSNYTVTASMTGYNFTSRAVSVGKSRDFSSSSGNVWGVDFADQSVTISTSASPTAGGSTSGSATYASGASVTVTATPNTGYTFTNWTENLIVVSTSASYTFTATASHTLVANFQQTPWATWQASHFWAAELQDPTICGTLQNPENDGICNLLKYAFNLSRENPDRSALPKISVENGYPTLTYAANKAATDITFTVEVSSDLQTWHSGATYTSTPTLISDDGFTQTLQVTDLTPTTAASAQFMRLRVTGP